MSMSVAINNPNQHRLQRPQNSGTYRPLQEFPSEQYTPAPPALTGQQQSSNNNVVVFDQPAEVVEVTVTSPIEKPNPSVFIVTVILMSLCTFCGMVHLLICFVPALILSVAGFNFGYSKSKEVQQQGRLFSSVAIGLNIFAGVFFCLTLLIIAIVSGIAIGCPYQFLYGTSCV